MSWTTKDIPDQTGRVVVVTGANSGLGLEAARELARKGAHVVVTARNMDKGADAEADIRAAVPRASLSLRQLDLASKESIRSFAESLLSDQPVIDQLYNNAGVMATPEWQTEDGFEMQFGTNHLGHFYLTFLLLPALLKSSGARIVNTTSTARFFAGDYDLDNPHMRGEYEAWTAYGYSKLANLQFALELNARLREAGAAVTAYAADPGFSDTNLQSTSAINSPGSNRQEFFHKWVPRVGQSAARGALTLLRAGTDPGLPGGSLVRPRWVARGEPVKGGIGAKLRKPGDLRKLWEVSEKELGITFDVPEAVEKS